MAPHTLSLLTFFSSLALFPLVLVSSRSLSTPSSRTCILNVTASLHQAKYSSSVTDQSETSIDSPTSSALFTLNLHPRDSLVVHNSSCLYEVSYGDGSYTVGDFIKETLTFDGGDTVEGVALGCGHSNEGLFIGAGGLLGLGGGALSLPSQLNASSFSYCLVDRDSNSASTLEFNSDDSPSQDSVSAPMVKNRQMDTFYYLGITGITVGGETLEVPENAFKIDNDGNGGVIIDSGTAVTRLESAVYELLRREFRKGASHLATAEGVAIFDTCYDLRGQSSVAVPAVELEFAGGKTLQLPAKNFMIPVDLEGTFCFAFAGTASSLSIIGNVQQQGTRVRFDLVNSLVTFEPNKC
ncbi:hypothetical protein Cgig2_010720 [Carnegiea gigantea]|uniref:Peptidase A1 domain-containing protein n=1 Tax=Carnegiea gigantea TaxID=171969 RepID=A0A9Q1QKA0_9CARY|nr:hypothetical protein Cgig2_010720 [Carnegiea gigantea]